MEKTNNINQSLYSKILYHAKELKKSKKLLWQNGILADKMIDLIAGEDLSKTVRAHIEQAQKLVGVPLFCSISCDHNKNQSFLVFRNLKNNALIDAKLWHLPRRFMDAKYSFYVVWVDSDERLEFDPEFSVPVVITNQIKCDTGEREKQ